MKSRCAVLAVTLAIAAVAASPARAQASDAKGRVFILVVWDGLRPDLVTRADTPNLFAMAREGARFDRHHSVFPTMTMPNAAALSTGAMPGEAGILAYSMYLGPALEKAPAAVRELVARPTGLESDKLLQQLNGPGGFDGHLLGLDSVAQEVEREGGFIAVVGKRGPVFLFDDRVTSVKEGRDLLHSPHKDYMFASDELALPEQAAGAINEALKPRRSGKPDPAARDAAFARIVADRAIPAAKAAAAQGRPALIVLWQHEPDAAQHRAGLGTLEDLRALGSCDANLAVIRDAITRAGIGDKTDLMVVSDHGFATIRMTVDLGGQLVAAGLKESSDSADIVIANSGGADLLYLSPARFNSAQARRDILQKIVDFAEAQEWCGPIFAREPAPPAERRRRRSSEYLGAVDGTFSQAAVGIFNQSRSPDLVISFREYPDLDNAKLTGPGYPAFAIDAHGQHAVANRSKDVIRPIKGLVYADTVGGGVWTSGMGMHGAAGTRELHNFCAAVGPDFRSHFSDRAPTGNADVAVTISRILHLEPNIGPGGMYASGRVIEEALDGGRAPGAPRMVRMTASLELRGMRVVTTLSATQLGRWLYLDDSSVEHVPLGRSP